MKVAIDCDCLLLERSLEIFLQNHLSNKNSCDFIITDKHQKFDKPVFIIAKQNSHLKVPFNRENLMNLLGEFYSAIQIPAAKFEEQKEEKSPNLEAKIDALFAKFKKDLMEILVEK